MQTHIREIIEKALPNRWTGLSKLPNHKVQSAKTIHYNTSMALRVNHIEDLPSWICQASKMLKERRSNWGSVKAYEASTLLSAVRSRAKPTHHSLIKIQHVSLQFMYSSFSCTVMLQLPRGNSLIFFRTPSLKSQKNHTQNHKIIRKITYGKHPKSQITEKLLKNHTKKSLEITKITKNHREKIMWFQNHKNHVRYFEKWFAPRQLHYLQNTIP